MTRAILPVLIATPFFASCVSSSSATPRTEAKVEVNRFTGKWYEIARFPKWFQKGCVSATAEYTKNDNGPIRVLNTCIRADGSRQTIEGLAEPVDGSASRLRVSFPGNWYSKLMPVPEEGNYWIIDVSAGYRHAIVGTPDRKSLWLLSRSPSIPRREFDRMKSTAEGQGFETGKLRVDGHTRLVD